MSRVQSTAAHSLPYQLTPDYTMFFFYMLEPNLMCPLFVVVQMLYISGTFFPPWHTPKAMSRSTFFLLSEAAQKVHPVATFTWVLFDTINNIKVEIVNFFSFYTRHSDNGILFIRFGQICNTTTWQKLWNRFSIYVYLSIYLLAC